MLLERRAQMLKKLPAEYQAVRYIESTGSQYIDTGYPQNDLRITDITFALMQPRDAFVIGAFQNSHCWSFLRLRDRDISIGWNEWAFIGVQANVGDVHRYETELSVNIRKMLIDGVEMYKSTDEKDNSTSQDSTLLLAYRYVSNVLVEFGAIGRLYHCKLYGGEMEKSLVRNFVPCYRISDNVIGLYDLCGSICPLTNSPFYINAGSGTFLKGGDV